MDKRGKESSELYDNPRYYEIAFSFRDIPAEVNVFEHCFKRFSQIPVKSVLESGCGNSLLLPVGFFTNGKLTAGEEHPPGAEEPDPLEKCRIVPPLAGHI